MHSQKEEPLAEDYTEFASSRAVLVYFDFERDSRTGGREAVGGGHDVVVLFWSILI